MESTYWKPACYVLFNMVTAVGIVFANKAVFAVYHFQYPILLTLLHTVATFIGMNIMASVGIFEPKALPVTKLLDLAVAYALYIILGNLSIKLNPVGFYQLTKALIAPTILAINSVSSSSWPSLQTIASITVLTAGITFATVSDAEVMSHWLGILVGVAYVVSTSMYNIWAGSKQQQLKAASNQLLHRFSPYAAMFLAATVPIAEHPLASDDSSAPRFTPSVAAVATMALSAALGLLVTLSTFLVIRHTSALTYNVVGHLKTIGIITGGLLFYQEGMSSRKVAGLAVAAAGVLWYSSLQMKRR